MFFSDTGVIIGKKLQLIQVCTSLFVKNEKKKKTQNKTEGSYSERAWRAQKSNET